MPARPDDQIPFEPQHRVESERMCGAAALSMVYGSFGIDRSQSEIWEAVARADARGKRAARTYLLAADALEHGLSALVIEASRPWSILRQCASASIRVILNHRLAADSPLGHYSVLVGIDEERIFLHDPHRGPNRQLARDAFLDLWSPGRKSSEVIGNILVAIGSLDGSLRRCVDCETPLPDVVDCPRCGRTIRLEPAAALACVAAECGQRSWRRLYCPGCDYGLGSLTES